MLNVEKVESSVELPIVCDPCKPLIAAADVTHMHGVHRDVATGDQLLRTGRCVHAAVSVCAQDDLRSVNGCRAVWHGGECGGGYIGAVLHSLNLIKKLKAENKAEACQEEMLLPVLSRYSQTVARSHNI